MVKFLGSVLLFMSLCASAMASPEDVGDTMDKPSDYTFNAYLDTSYNYLSRSNKFISGNPNRNFDLQTNGFTLQQAAVLIAKQPDQGWGGLMNIIVGRDANTMAAYGTNPYWGVQNVGLDMVQLYAQYSVSTFTTMVGKFLSLSGVEACDPTYNSNFSHAYTDQAELNSVLGIREVDKLNEHLQFSVGVNNGWNNIRDHARQKTLELGVIYKPDARWSFTGDIYTGRERLKQNISNGATGRRNLIDLIGSYAVTDRLSLVLNYDYGMQTSASLPNNVVGLGVWQGLVGYINFKINHNWRTSFRSELFLDPDGFNTGVRQNIRDFTFTLAYTAIKHLELRAETRRDMSNVNAFLDRNGVNTSNNNQSFALECLYTFA